MKRVRTILNKHDVQELVPVPVLVWLPPELAEQVRQMAAPYEQPQIDVRHFSMKPLFIRAALKTQFTVPIKEYRLNLRGEI